MINFLSVVMPKLAIIIPLFILMYCCYSVYQNKNIASQDRRIYSEGVEGEGKIVNIEHSKNKYSSGVIVATLTVVFFVKGEEVWASRALKYEVHQADNIKVGAFVRLKFIPDNAKNIVYLDYNAI